VNARIYLLCCSILIGADIFFAAVAAPAVFSRAIAGLPRDDVRRQMAADAVGTMLARLDAATLVLCAVAALSAFGRRAALLPLAAGLCALASSAWVTPAIRALRAAGETGSPRFRTLHGISSGLVLVEIVLLAVAAWTAAGSARTTDPIR